MNGAMLEALLRRLGALERQSVRLRVGEVTATSPLSVAVGGSDVPWQDVKCLASYSPTVGDLVAVQIVAHTLLVLGEIT